MSNYYWNPDTHEYEEEDDEGHVHVVPWFTIRVWINEVVDFARSETADLSERYRDGEIDVEEWRLGMRDILRNEFLAIAYIASGGIENITPAQLAKVSQILSDQYKYLDNFAHELELGAVTLDGRFIARSQSYAANGILIFEGLLLDAMKDLGIEECRNILGTAHHCGECPELSDAGWMPIDNMVPVGLRECGGSCNCALEYR